MKKVLIFSTIVFSFLQLSAQTNSVWIETTSNEVSNRKVISNRIYSENQRFFKFKSDEFKESLINVADKSSGLPGVVVSFPNIDGELEKFLVWENSNFEPGLQAKYPNIRAYIGKSLTDKGATINFSFSPRGVQTMVLRPDKGSEFIESYTKDNAIYVLFDSKTRIKSELPFVCGVIDQNLNEDVLKTTQNTAKTSVLYHKTLRLAISCTGEYAQYYGGTTEGALAAMNATMTRVNGVFEKDLAVHLNIIDNNDLVIYTDADTDPYSPASIGTTIDPNDPPFHVWSTELQGALTSNLGNGAYDIGHLFGLGKGEGNSGGIGNVCVDDDGAKGTQSKGKAYSSPFNDIPGGDSFDISTVAHEMGHQLGAQHTFSFQFENGLVQVEPGSGSTIMGYAGITNWNVQPQSDDYFTFRSISQIQSTLDSKSCPVSTPIMNNTTPIVDAGADFSIPSGTAYVLKGIVSDADGDSLTYCWEQNNTMTSGTQQGNLSVPYPTKTQGPTFRSFLPVSSPIRYMPNFSDVLAGNGNLRFSWESVSVVARTLHFTLTVRDNNVVNGAQTQTDEVVVTSQAQYNASTGIGAGPFVVTSQNITGVSWTVGDAQTITWSVNNTTSLPGSTNVNIKLSIDGGASFPYV
ncbi:MAG: reprolysin-like metallopeptidase, partial [Flavobacterium sp.]